MQRKSKIILIISIFISIILLGTSFYFIFSALSEKQKREEHKKAVETYYQNKFVIYEEENARFNDYDVDVAFLGDSLTDLYDLQKYYPQFVTANRGIGGDTTFGLEERLPLSVYDLKPKVAVLLIGVNNIETMFENYESILIGFKENLPQTKIVLLSLTPTGREWSYKNQIAALHNVKIKLMAQKYGYEYLDIFTPLFDLSSGELYAAYTNDGLHFTATGYEVITNAVTPTLNALLAEE